VHVEAAMTEAFSIEIPGRGRVSAIAYGPAAAPTLLLGHGAGSNQKTPAIVHFAEALAARGKAIMTYNFLYSEARRRIPDSNDALEETARAAIDAARERARGAALYVGGRSMGGRIASQVVARGDAGEIAGLVLLGYPLHPPGRPEQLRTKHLPNIRVPVLVVQGARDAFGTPDELRPALATVPAKVDLVLIDEADHSFKVPKRSSTSQAQVTERIVDVVAAWIRGSSPSRPLAREEE
jgi:predicted alpha/beta-hydrolase family hydrolase